MSYIDRLRGDIQLTSPNGDVFNPKWIGNSRSKDKKLGVFEYPNVDGTKVQDLGVNGTRYPLTLHFDGADNDLESTKFYNSCDEKGTWSVLHPTKGELNLQLESITEQIEPVESGTITVFETSWIEVILDESTVSGKQLGATVSAESLTTNIACIAQYSGNIITDTASAILANLSAITDVVDIIYNIFEDIMSTVDEVNAQFEAVVRGIEDSINEVVTDLETIASQVQSLAQLPSLVVDKIEDSIDLYTSAIDSIIDLIPTSIDPESKNKALAYELGLTAMINAITLTTVGGELETRTQVIEISESLVDLLATVTESLDTVQSNFDESDIDKQYFSQSGAYNDLKILVATTLNYLTESALGLKVEKRFTLEKSRCPLEISVTEYGDLDSYDFFVDTNKLSGKDILLLPAGREVVVYV